MTQDELLQRIKERLQALFGERFRGLVLFGSSARGDARPDSDIDALCLLDALLGGELWDITHALYPLQLEIVERELSVFPVGEEKFEAGDFALYRNAKREGILI